MRLEAARAFEIVLPICAVLAEAHNLGIVHRVLRGEGRSVATSVVDDFRSTVIPRLLNEYDPADIYNADESGLVYLA